MWEAIIGVGGTLAGTLLGWLLAKWKTGKLKINLGNLYNEQFHRCGANYGAYIPDKKESEVYSYSVDFDISLYNESERTKTIRDLTLSFRDVNNNELFAKKVDNGETQRLVSNHFKIDKVGVVNLSGFAGLDIKARVSVGENNIDNLYRTKKIYLCYKNEKFKTNEKLLCEDFIPSEKQILEEINNG